MLIALIGVLVFLIFGTESGNMNVFRSYEKSAYREYELNEKYMKLMGRSTLVDDELVLSHSGSGIEFICKGDYAEITVAAESEYLSSANYPRIAVYTDGNLVIDECISEEKTYRISTSYNGTKIRLIKLSEAMCSSLKVTGVASYGVKDIEPTKKGEIKIEFIGDSITCGYGIDTGVLEGFKASGENFSKTYAYYTAEKLSADYSAICYSGYGVLSGFTTGGIKSDKTILTQYYKACHLTGNEDPLWDFSKSKNDLVVINLGTNDASYCSGSYPRRQSFVQAYINLLTVVRENNPDAYILCVLGDMNNSLYPSIETAVASYKEAYSDNGVEAFAIQFKMGENDIVIDGHPGEKSNLCAGQLLTEKINSLINYGYIER